MTPQISQSVPKITLSVHEMAIDCPNHPVIFTLDSPKPSGADISRSNNNSNRSKKSTTTIDMDNFEEQLNDKCCFGFINILTLLQIITLANFLFDGICTYLSLHTITTYLFALSATGSLLCLCAVISAVQEEKHKMLGTTAIWVSLKLLVVGILYITATASMVEFYYSNDSIVIEPELIILFFFIPFCMVFLGLQWKMTIKVVNLIQARDEFYIIPSAHGSVEMRPSLRLYLAAQKLKDLQKF
uniref:Uncharacterized protein n=1 Tax=Panagrolaimus sp. ES5 TaxID=591445 RepID=A0AC34F3G7_9BILA